MKGADTTVKDKDGRVAIYYTKDIDNKEDMDNIRNILTGQKTVSDILSGTVPIHKLQRNKTNLMIFYAVFMAVQILKILNIYSRLSKKWVISGLCLDIITVILHIALTRSDPGFLENDGLEFIKLLEAFDPQQLCPECKVIRTSRSRHCILCKKCVDRYDHHCPWVDNCIGIKNHNIFLVYLIFQLFTLIATIVYSIFVGMMFSKFPTYVIWKPVNNSVINSYFFFWAS